MGTFDKLENWGKNHQNKFFDVLRIILGLIIFMKGLFFIRNTSAMMEMLSGAQFEFNAFMLTHYVAIAHLVGGLLIMIGLITRISILFQIPIILGAIIFVNAKYGVFTSYTDMSELGLSVVVLILMLFFLIYGSGKMSVDRFMKKHKYV
jgi:putative oxidoreductase